MKRILLALALVLGLRTLVSAQTVPLYENFGSVIYRYDDLNNTPPQIDALAFANYGSFVITNLLNLSQLGFSISPVIPYEPNNTLNFTNRGTMRSLFGFRFDHATLSGRGQASNFINANGAVIDA